MHEALPAAARAGRPPQTADGPCLREILMIVFRVPVLMGVAGLQEATKCMKLFRLPYG